MTLIRHSLTRTASTLPIRSSAARPQPWQNAQKRYIATSGDITDSAGTPRWMWWTAGGGAGAAFYLWYRGHQKARAAAGQEIQEHHGANQEYVKKAEGN